MMPPANTFINNSDAGKSTLSKKKGKEKDKKKAVKLTKNDIGIPTDFRCVEKIHLAERHSAGMVPFELELRVCDRRV